MWKQKKETTRQAEEMPMISTVKSHIEQPQQQQFMQQTAPQAQPRAQAVQQPVQKERWLVVPELPMKPVREYQEDDGTIVHLITIDEALTTLMNN